MFRVCQSEISAATILCCTFFLSCLIACLSTIPASLAALCFSLAIFLFCRRLTASSLSSLLTVNFFILLVWCTVPFSTPGNIVWQWEFVKISEQGIRLSFLTMLKANAIVLLFMGLMSGMSSMQLGLALAQIHISQKLALILILSDKHLEILRHQWQILNESAKLRSFQAKSSFYSWKVIAAMLAFLLVRASDRADNLRDAFLLRGFSGKFPLCAPWKLNFKDCLLILFVLFLFSFLLILDWNFLHAS